MPRVTVLLPVFNGMPHLRHAVESIQRQTLVDYRALVFDDGSKDGTAAYLDNLNDPRFEIIHQENAGLAATLNRMIALTDTEYIARMDADDISLPERFAKQVLFLDTHPEVAVVGTRAGYVRGRHAALSLGFGTARITLSYAPPMADAPYWDPLRDKNILSHSSVMMRTDVLKSVGGYPDIVPGQDLALWHLMARAGHKLASLDEMLILFRISRSGISSSNLARQYHAWCHTDYQSRCLAEGRVPIPLEEYVRNHPLSAMQLDELRAKAEIRNALADLLAGRVVRGAATLAWQALRNPALVTRKIRSRI
jgi:glycosyltransferase involved in cell wall biosynthesis